MADWSNVNELCDIVRETSFEIHCYLRQGHLEKADERSLLHGLLINFGASKLSIKKYILSQTH
ncbi:hypothetical protein Pla108_24880 [Botrimarina colliarenosi]|uniref:Uncharacterized protein n=1 Tax=Botrimarina colliarenosi TaxID=2528001 RepID=A0A5C6A9N9_9BACT|nr:hypothetical protein Pla108_24880 [Botrimarina colliarenosi]